MQAVSDANSKGPKCSGNAPSSISNRGTIVHYNKKFSIDTFVATSFVHTRFLSNYIVYITYVGKNSSETEGERNS